MQTIAPSVLFPVLNPPYPQGTGKTMTVVFFSVSIQPFFFGLYSWVPLVSFFIVTACHPVIQGIIDILVGELFPSDIRTISIGIAHGIEYLSFAFATEAFPVLLKCLKFYGLTFYYASFCLAMTIWGMVTIKDIDRLSLVEIERIYDTKMDETEGSSQVSKSTDPNYGSLQ